MLQMARHSLHSTFFANKTLSLAAPSSSTVEVGSELDAQVAQHSFGMPRTSPLSTLASQQPQVAIAGGDRDVEMTA